MKLLKIDYPRRVDSLIDYFGELRPASSGSSPAGGAVMDPREPRRRDAAHGWSIVPGGFLSAVDAVGSELSVLGDLGLAKGVRARRETSEC